MSLNSQELQAATKAIEKAKRILIVPHANVDPDGISSALACYSVFNALGKDCTVVCPDTLPEALEFLPGFGKLSTSIATDQQFIITIDCSSGAEFDSLRYTIEDKKVNIIVTPKKGKFSSKNVSCFDEGSPYDLIVVVDSAELTLLGSFYTENTDVFTTTPILNIDHHVSNSRFGQTHLIDTVSASATEVLYLWFTQNPLWKDLITPDIATLLLTGLITDTRSFQNPNTTPRSLEVGANLLDLGARQQEIIQHIYKTKPLTTLKIWGRALNHIQIDPEARIVWSSVSREDLQEMGATSKETHGLLDELISTIPDADVHIMFTEVEEGGFKASMRSSPSIDVNAAAGRLFGGGGHARAAGFKMKNYSNFHLSVIDCIRQLKGELERQRSVSEPLPVVVPVVTPPRSTPKVELQDIPSTTKKQSEEKQSVDIVNALNVTVEKRDEKKSS